MPGKFFRPKDINNPLASKAKTVFNKMVKPFKETKRKMKRNIFFESGTRITDQKQLKAMGLDPNFARRIPGKINNRRDVTSYIKKRIGGNPFKNTKKYKAEQVLKKQRELDATVERNLFK
jgi:hypothetical protein